MKRLFALAVLIVLFSCFNLPAYAMQSLEGDWIGGLDFGNSWEAVNLHLKSAGRDLTGTIDFPERGRMAVAINRVVVENSRVHIDWKAESGLANLNGQFKDDTITGEVELGQTKASFGFVRIANVDAKIYDQYAGSYQLSHDRFVYVGINNANELRFVDSKTGRTGSLYPSSETTFFLGSTVDIPYPIEGRVEFLKKNGEVTGMTWRENGAPAVSGKRIPHKQEVVTFQNADATLTGTLFLPATTGAHPAVVMVYPGYSFPRRNSYFPYFLTQQNIAVLTLNGKTVAGKPADYQHSSFEERARDALAGVKFLKMRPEINSKQIGLHGASLSSWVVPLASTLSADVAFIILRVGSAIPPPDNILYEIENDLRERNFSDDEIRKTIALRRLCNTTILSNSGWDTFKSEVEKAKNERWFGYARVGWMLSLSLPLDNATLKGLQDPISYEPVAVLERVKVPVLAFNADLDKSVNTKVSLPIMEKALRKSGNKDITIVLLRNASHDLMEAKTGYNSEWVRLERFTPGYWDTMAAWLKKHTGM